MSGYFRMSAQLPLPFPRPREPLAVSIALVADRHRAAVRAMSGERGRA